MIKISRSEIELFVQCPRCFYLDVIDKIHRPVGFPVSLKSGVLALLRKEFDAHRQAGTQHPLQEKFEVAAIPAQHDQIDEWRKPDNAGVVFQDISRGFHLYGSIDDLWQNEKGEYHVVDYKATAKFSPVSVLPSWADAYCRQMEIKQWLLRKNGLNVSDISYFVYCTGDINAAGLNDHLDFHTHIIACPGDDSWVEQAVHSAYLLLKNHQIPQASDDCEFCHYVEQRRHIEHQSDALPLRYKTA